MRIEDFTGSGTSVVGRAVPERSGAGVNPSPPAPGFPDQGWVLPNPHLSHSQISLFLRCRRAYQREYILGEKKPSNGDLVLGSAVHGAIAWAVLQPDTAPAEAGSYFAEYQWPTQIEDEGDIDWRDQSPDQLAIKGRLMVETYMEQVAPRLQVAEVEKRIEIHLPEVPVPVIGYVDIVQTGNRPCIDMKTSKNGEKNILAHWQLQGRIYQIAEQRSVDWHILTKQATPQVMTSAQYPGLLQTYSERQAERTKQLLVRTAWEINHCYATHGEDEDWDWTGIVHTWACGRCAHKGGCPGWDGV